MNTRHLVDPALLPALDAFPALAATHETLPAVRAAMDGITRALAAAPVPVAPQEVRIPAPERHEVRALLLRPADHAGPLPAVLHIHGGAYIIGTPEMSVPERSETARQLADILTQHGVVLLRIYQCALEKGHSHVASTIHVKRPPAIRKIPARSSDRGRRARPFPPASGAAHSARPANC